MIWSTPQNFGIFVGKGFGESRVFSMCFKVFLYRSKNRDAIESATSPPGRMAMATCSHVSTVPAHQRWTVSQIFPHGTRSSSSIHSSGHTGRDGKGDWDVQGTNELLCNWLPTYLFLFNRSLFSHLAIAIYLQYLSTNLCIVPIYLPVHQPGQTRMNCNDLIWPHGQKSWKK